MAFPQCATECAGIARLTAQTHTGNAGTGTASDQCACACDRQACHCDWTHTSTLCTDTGARRCACADALTSCWSCLTCGHSEGTRTVFHRYEYACARSGHTRARQRRDSLDNEKACLRWAGVHARELQAIGENRRSEDSWGITEQSCQWEAREMALLLECRGVRQAFVTLMQP